MVRATFKILALARADKRSISKEMLRFFPAGPCNRNRETLMVRVASYLTLYCSQRPANRVETSQSRRKEGGLQTTFELYFGLL